MRHFDKNYIISATNNEHVLTRAARESVRLKGHHWLACDLGPLANLSEPPGLGVRAQQQFIRQPAARIE